LIIEMVVLIFYPILYDRAAAGAPVDKQISTPVQPGTNEVSVTVAVVYLIP